MTITRDHVSDLAEKASPDEPRSGKNSPSATAATTVAAPRNAEAAPNTKKGAAVVTLATLRSLPENEEVTLYLDVVPAAGTAATPAGPKPPPRAAQNLPKPPRETAAASEFDKFLKRPCPDLGGLLHTLEEKIASPPPRGRRSVARSEAEEEVVATVSQCVIVRKISGRDEGGGACAAGGRIPRSSAPMPPPPPAASSSRGAEGKKCAAASKVDATIDACLLGESQIVTAGEGIHRCALSRKNDFTLWLVSLTNLSSQRVANIS